MEDNMGICANCEEEVLASELIEIGGRLYCSACSDSYIGTCEQCGVVAIFGDDNYGSTHLILCQACYDEYYTSCSSCDRIISNSDACYFENEDDAYCGDCYSDRCDNNDEEEETYIYNYSFKPKNVLFYGTGKRFYGLELEMDSAGKSTENARRLLEIGNKNHDHIYIKADSSIDSGFEVVTHAMSLDYHRNHFNWQEILDAAIEMGYRSHKTTTCGLHIHISRAGLGDSYDEQEATISRILYFFEKHFDNLLIFSRRTLANLNRWASRYGYKENPYEILDHAKKCYNGRYTCVNLLNNDTIEARIFRGSLKLNTLIAAIELMEEICTKAINLTDEEMQLLSWRNFVQGINKNEMLELIEYLKIRQLYVNDAIETEEDI
jgi:hypothetical protein